MYHFLTQTPLFQGVSETEIPVILGYLDCYQREYQKGQFVYEPQDSITHIGLVLSGNIIVEHNDIWGNKSILRYGKTGEVFAETCLGISPSPILVSVIAAEPTTVLFLNIERILSYSPDHPYHELLIYNVVHILTNRNMELYQRILHTTPKSIRKRLLSYFSEQMTKQNTTHIVIPFNRQQMADYLGVDRSALSGELSKMSRDGLITYRKNQFTIHVPLA